MKRSLPLLLFSCLVIACQVPVDERQPSENSSIAVPDSVEFVAWGDQGDGTYVNPVIWADFNNPFLLQREEDFYLIAASHHYMGMPVLHSKDLINWTLINRIYRRIPDIEKYNIPGRAYKHGSWAPTMTYHDGYFRMYVMNSTDGLFTSKAAAPAGDWEPLQLIHQHERWEDPYVFWDDDGEAYLFHSGKRVAPVMIHRMNREGTKILDEGKVIVEPNGHNPFVIKRDGYYYLFVASGRDSEQRVYRATDIMGPYEQKVILEESGIGPSPGGGGMAELENGTYWYMHHVGMKGHGRMPFLERMRWTDGWPFMGIDTDGNSIGEPGRQFPKPVASIVNKDLSFYDDFTSPALKLEWTWNHNPDPSRFRTGNGTFTIMADTLYALEGIDGSFVPVSFEADDIRRARNTLAFMPVGVYGEATTTMRTTDMVDGQRAGFAFFNQAYFWVGVVQENGKKQLMYYTPEEEVLIQAFEQEECRFKAYVENGSGRLAYSLDGKNFVAIDYRVQFDRQWFENHKIALFSYNVLEPMGEAVFEEFSYLYVDGRKR